MEGLWVWPLDDEGSGGFRRAPPHLMLPFLIMFIMFSLVCLIYFYISLFCVGEEVGFESFGFPVLDLFVGDFCLGFLALCVASQITVFSAMCLF